MNASEFVLVDISNVASWFYSSNDQEQYDWTTDFPSMMPAWKKSEYEWLHPRTIRSEGKTIKVPHDTGLKHQAQVLVIDTTTTELLSGKLFDNLLDSIRKAANSPKLRFDRESMGSVERLIEHVVKNDIDLMAAVFVRWTITKQGAASQRTEGAMALILLDKLGNYAMPTNPALLLPSPAIQQVGEEATAGLLPLAFAWSLINCRNVKVVDRPVSRQMQRRAERTGEPLVVKKELVIEPFRQQVRNEAKGDGMNEIKRALHLCRGHFREYTDEKPLFGRVTGRFWIPQHLRGLKDIGEVHKTYRVDTDEK